MKSLKFALAGLLLSAMPAMAEELIMVTIVTVKPATIPDNASGSNTCQRICLRLQPIACATSINP